MTGGKLPEGIIARVDVHNDRFRISGHHPADLHGKVGGPGRPHHQEKIGGRSPCHGGLGLVPGFVVTFVKPEDMGAGNAAAPGAGQQLFFFLGDRLVFFLVRYLLWEVKKLWRAFS